MATLLPHLTAEQADPATRGLFAQVAKGLGMVPNLYATVAHAPAAFRGMLAFQGELQHGELKPRELELVALHLAQLNGCGYCLSAHQVLGPMAGLSATEIDRARGGVAETPREQAILDFVGHLVRSGGSSAADEVAVLRRHGMKNAEIIELLAHYGLLSFMTAIGVIFRPVIDFPVAPRIQH